MTHETRISCLLKLGNPCLHTRVRACVQASAGPGCDRDWWQDLRRSNPVTCGGSRFLKAASPCLQLRSALDKTEELEVSNGHLVKRLEKMKANRSVLLSHQ